MKIKRNVNVLDAALERVEWLYGEFPEVIVSFSGGKDSTAILWLAVEVARKLDRLPVKVMFLDQEAEWGETIKYMRHVMSMDEVEPVWIQVPMLISNATSQFEKFLKVWDPENEDGWMRPKEECSIKENIFGTNRFYKMFKAIPRKLFPGKTCFLAGVRTQESPRRYGGCTLVATYKHVTYGKVLNKGLHYTFYPIYDWELKDVWKTIHDNDLRYNRIYDFMWQAGYSVQQMRVSSLHHETSVMQLFRLHELEGETWSKLTTRLNGVSTAGHMSFDNYFARELPRAFGSWKEYRDYLVENLSFDEEQRAKYAKKFASLDERYEGMHHIDDLQKVCVNTLLVNDVDFVKVRNWEFTPTVHSWRQSRKGIGHHSHTKSKYING